MRSCYPRTRPNSAGVVGDVLAVGDGMQRRGGKEGAIEDGDVAAGSGGPFDGENSAVGDGLVGVGGEDEVVEGVGGIAEG